MKDANITRARHAGDIINLLPPPGGYVFGYGVVIYPTAVYASCDIGLAYPTAVYTRFISSLAYPTAMYTRSVLVYPYFNHFFLKLTLLKCNNKLNKFNSESGPWPISDYPVLKKIP